ncbi:hypothetical protein AAG906_026652 [Vitis piasezkii]
MLVTILHWCIPPSLSSADLLCTFSLLDLFLDLYGYHLGHPPTVTLFGASPTVISFGASPHCHLRLGHPPTVISFGASPNCHLRLGHPPTSSSSLLSFGVQSHHRFLDRHLESHPRFDVQSHHHHFSPRSSRHRFRIDIESHPWFDVRSSSSLFSLGVEPSLSLRRSSHHRFLDRHLESHHRFDVQSHHHHFSVSAFRAVIGFQIDIQKSSSSPLSFGVQSHHRFSDRRSESSSSLLSFGIQSHHRFSDPHSESHPRFRHSESLSLLSLTFRVIFITFQCGVQSRHRFSVLAFIAITIFGLGFQSHYCHLASRAISVVSFKLPEPFSSSCLGFQSHYCHLASRAITAISFRLPEPFLPSRLGFQSHFCHLASRAIIVVSFRLPEPFLPSPITVVSFRLLEPFLSSRLGFQSHFCHLPSLSSRLGFHSHFCHLLLLSSLAFRVSFFIWLPELLFSWFSSFYFLSLVLRVGLVIQSHNSWRSCPLALHILPSGFCIRPRLSSLRYPVLIAYSSRTPGWFDRYSSLTLIS